MCGHLCMVISFLFQTQFEFMCGDILVTNFVRIRFCVSLQAKLGIALWLPGGQHQVIGPEINQILQTLKTKERIDIWKNWRRLVQSVVKAYFVLVQSVVKAYFVYLTPLITSSRF